MYPHLLLLSQVSPGAMSTISPLAFIIRHMSVLLISSLLKFSLMVLNELVHECIMGTGPDNKNSELHWFQFIMKKILITLQWIMGAGVHYKNRSFSMKKYFSNKKNIFTFDIGKKYFSYSKSVSKLVF